MLLTCAICLLPILLVWPIGPCIVVALSARRERAEDAKRRADQWERIFTGYAARGIK